MKKKILMGAFALALLVTAGFGVNKSMKSDADLSDLALLNVEALATGEIDFPWLCRQTSPKVCKIDIQMYLGDRIW